LYQQLAMGFLTGERAPAQAGDVLAPAPAAGAVSVQHPATVAAAPADIVPSPVTDAVRHGAPDVGAPRNII